MNDDGAVADERAARRERAAKSAREAEFAKTQRGNFFVRNHARLQRWWMETNRNDLSLYLFAQTSAVRRNARKFIAWVWFERLTLGTIVANCVTLAMYKPLRPESSWNKGLDGAETAFTVIFTIEFLARVVANNFMFGPPEVDVYLRDGWRVLDFIVVVGGWVSIAIVAAGGSSGGLTAIRGLRALRPLRTISGFPTLRVFVSTTFSSLGMVMNVLLFILVVILVLGILGVQRFAGKLSNRCAYASTLELVVDELEFPCSIKKGGRPCGPSQVCIPTDFAGMDQGHSNFDNIVGASFIIYRSLTLRGWADLMYRVIDGTGDHVMTIFYFVVTVTFGSIFISSFVLAAVATKYRQSAILDGQTAKEDDRVEAIDAKSEKAKSVKRAASKKGGRLRMIERLNQIMERPLSFMRTELSYQKWLKRFVLHGYFQNVITLAIVVNTFVLAIQYRGMDLAMETFCTNVNYFFLATFVAEMLLKVLALGILGYFGDRYNVFDATIVVAGLVEIAYQDSSLSVARAFRLLRVIRATKVITRNKALRRLIDITVESFASVFSFCGVLVVFIFVFTVLGMQLFGGRPEFWDVRPNFNTFGDSFLSVFEILTGSRWYKLMLIAMSGSFGAPAAIYFVLWSFLGSFVLLNLVSAMLIDTFSRIVRSKEAEVQKLADEALEAARRATEAKRKQDIKMMLSRSETGEDIDEEPENRNTNQVSAHNEMTSRVFKTKSEILRHPDARRVMSKIRLRKNRNFAREVVLIENWLDKMGFVGDDDDFMDDGEGEQKANEVIEELENKRQQMLTEAANDDGAPEAELTTGMIQKTQGRVDSYIAHGILIPTDDKQVRSAYRRWKIDAAAQRGSDGEDHVHVMDAKTLRDEYRTDEKVAANAMEARKNLQESALADLRRTLLERSGDAGMKDALTWASSAPTKGLVAKSAEARLRPKEQTAIIAQRRAEGKASGSTGKYKGSELSAEGAAIVAEANMLSVRLMDEAEREKQKQVQAAPTEANNDTATAKHSTESSLAEARRVSWRDRTLSTERQSISEALRGMDDRPQTGPVTESFNGNALVRDIDTASNSRSAETPNRSQSHGSQTTGDTELRYGALTPVIEYTQMPGLLEVDYSLPRIKEDPHAGKARRAIGLPVRDIVIDETKAGKVSARAADDDWFRNPTSDQNELCMMYTSLGFLKPRLPIRRLLYLLIKHELFERLMLVIIVLSCVQLAATSPTLRPDSEAAKVMKAAELSFTLIFVCEAVLKIVTMGFVMHPGAYLRSSANVFDFVIVLFSVVVEMSTSASQLKFMRSFRLFRALRPLRLLNRVKSMQLVVATLVHILPDLMNVLILGTFQFLIFAILGSQLFSGKFDFCNDPTVTGREACVGMFVDANGVYQDRQWLHPPLNFDNTVISMLSLFVVVTRDGWLDIVFQGMDSTSVDTQPSLNSNGWTAVYFLTFIVLLSFVWLSMIVALVCENYRVANELSDSGMTLTPEQQEWAEVLRMKKQEAALKVMEDDSTSSAPKFFLRKSAFSLATNPRFEAFIVCCIIANTATMASFHEGQPSMYSDLQRAANMMFSWIFLLELGLKMFALFPRRYFSERWNVFDFIIVVASIPDLAGVDFVGTTVLRVIRLGRVLRLFRQAKGLRAVFNTLVSSVEGVMHVLFLVFMLMFVYAVLGMNLFADYDTNEPSGRTENFRDFGSSMMVLLRVLSRDNWKRTMFDTMKCSYDVDGVAANCTHIVVPGIYFTSFIFFGAYVLLSLVIAVILSKFTENAVNEGLLSTANVFVTIRRKLLLDMFATRLRKKLEEADAASGRPRRAKGVKRR